MNTKKITDGINKVNEIIAELKELKDRENEYANEYYNNHGGFEYLEKACEIINKIGYKEGGLYRRMKNLIKEYYESDCEWLDSMATDYGRDEDLKVLRMYRKFKGTFKYWGVAIAEY